ncbi:MAG: cation diffusion facilitator family transporter [Armatimonadetes bacterium]|nr:cation diffusion facilitator family transporter [Armatimonadota bacterium]
MKSGQDVVETGARLSLGVTTVNVVVKLAAGFVTGSVSVLAEGLQSGVDILISYGVLKTVRMSSKPPDAEHPYGHGKAEFLLGAGQMLVIILTALVIIWQASRRFLHPEPIEVAWGVAAMVFSAIANYAVSRRLDAVGTLHKSNALKGEAAHLRGDLMASLGVLVGLILVRLTGLTILDPIVAIVFMIVVIHSAIRQLREFLHPLMDGAIPHEDREKIEKVLTDHPDAKGFHALRTRTVGATQYVEFHLLLDDNLTFVAAHEQAEEIEEEIGAALGGAIVNVHYEPYLAELEHQKRNHPDGI